jgi:branched-chain amino acid transport system permease protein
MDQLLLFVLLGLGQGALIAGIALGVVITYRGSGIINLATGAVAMIAGYGFWSLRTGFFGVTLPTVPALVGALLAAALTGLATEYLAFRPLRSAPALAKLAASLGVLLTAQAGILLTFGTDPQQEPAILPGGTVNVLGTVIPQDRFLLTGIVVVLAVLLAMLYRRTRFGLATRATAENERAAVLIGLSTQEIALVNTLLASLVAGLLGVLAAPIVQLDTITLPLQVVPALAAALFARFTSLGTACGTGILIGVLQSLLYYVSTFSWFPTDRGNALPGIQQVLIFAVMILALFLRGADLPGRGELVQQRLPLVPVSQRPFRAALTSAAVCAIALVVFPFDFRQALTNSLIGAVIVLSFVVITGYVGQISVVQLAISGTAGFALSHLTIGAGLGFPFGALVAIAGATLLGVLTGVSALRVRGVGLAVVTLAAALAMEQALFTNTAFGGLGGGVPVPSPTLFGVDLGPDGAYHGLDGAQPSPVFGFGVLAVTVAIGLYVANLRRTALGQQMIAVRANERAAAAAGIDVRSVKITAFVISSFVASVAGVLYGYNFASVSSTRFTALASLGLLGFAYVGGITMVSGAVFAGLLSTEALVPHALDVWFGISGTWALLFGGVSLILTLVMNPDGIAGARYRGKQRRQLRRARGSDPEDPGDPADPGRSPAQPVPAGPSSVSGPESSAVAATGVTS